MRWGTSGDDIVYSHDVTDAYHRLSLPINLYRPSELASLQISDFAPEFSSSYLGTSLASLGIHIAEDEASVKHIAFEIVD